MPSPPRRLAIASFATLALLVVSDSRALPEGPDPPRGIRGFSAKGAAEERDVEGRFRAVPSPDEARRWHSTFTSVPHPATSPANHDVALQIAEAWKEQGLEDVVIRQYDVLSSNPRQIQVEMTAPTHYVPTLREDAYPEDPGTRNGVVAHAFHT